MSLWPRSLGVRIAGALVFAVGAVLALSLAVSAWFKMWQWKAQTPGVWQVTITS